MALAGDGFRHLHLSATFPQRRPARRFPLLLPTEEKVHATYSETRPARSYPKHTVRLRQYVPLPYRIRTGRTHRTDDFHHRRTDRSHHLEYLPRFLHRTQRLYCPELRRRTNRTGIKSLAHHPMDDGNLRNVLHAAVCLLRQ